MSFNKDSVEIPVLSQNDDPFKDPEIMKDLTAYRQATMIRNNEVPTD
jgi:hypothetical protein